MALLSFFSLPLNAVVLTMVCRGDYEHGVWLTWIGLHYVVMFIFIMTIFLSPLAFLLYWVIQQMKYYAVTFESQVPCL